MGEVTERTIVWNDAVHAELEWNYALGYEHGYRAGLDAANAAMDRLLASWASGPTGYQLTPPPTGAKDVVGRMLRAMQRQVTDCQAATVRVDHPSGPVHWEAAA